MYQQEKIKPYNNAQRKGQQVEKMFDHIAHSYDSLNHVLSLGIDRRWRREAIRSLRPYRPQHILDVATGTGDFALEAAQRLKPQHLTAVDLSEGMLNIARKKILEANLARMVSVERQDCMRLTFPDNSFDAVTVAYGIRNFENLEQGLHEMLRVLKPGGRLVIIELTTPRRTPMKQLFWIYAHLYMPCVGRLISKDKRAYTYLPATMEAFPQGERMQQIMTRIGYADVRFKRYTFGLSTLYTAAKPR